MSECLRKIVEESESEMDRERFIQMFFDEVLSNMMNDLPADKKQKEKQND